MTNRKVLTIGVLTFNNTVNELSRWYRSLQLALKKLDNSIDTRVLCLDNGDKSWLTEKDQVRALTQIGNVGFSRGVNHLMEEAFGSLRSDFFITCNPDGFFHPFCLKNMIADITKNPNAIIEARTFPEEHPKIYQVETGETNWAVGCCLLIPREIYRATQGFDPSFFLYLEDVDFSWRCRLLGYRIIYSANSIYGHGLQGRSETSSPRRLHLLKAGTYFASKWGLKEGLAECERELKQVFGTPPVPSTTPTSIQTGNGKCLCEGDFFIFSKVRW